LFFFLSKFSFLFMSQKFSLPNKYPKYEKKTYLLLGSLFIFKASIEIVFSKQIEKLQIRNINFFFSFKVFKLK